MLLIFLINWKKINANKDEPRCYSRFDWEDKLLEKTIRTDIKVDQLMVQLEKAVLQMKDVAAMAVSATYIRWGRTTCPGNGSEPVYDGYAGGSLYNHQGAAASMLCLPKDPDWNNGRYSDKLDPFTGYVYGAEYQDGQDRSDQLFGESHYDYDVPCVVCEVRNRSSVIMTPGKSRCYGGYTFEYSGFLMSGHYKHSTTDYYCVDKNPENLPDGKNDHNGRLLYFVEARCGSLRCPPYVDGRELQCVVCTK